ncbi:MAG: RNA methyltransferase, partial [Lachnospiraceae bacterium]|nr:RNA methyltransferase [Lachnospiraceae bacterium]
MITSPANAKIKNIIKLQKRSRERREQDVFIVEGVRMFREAPRALIKEVFISESLARKNTLADQLSGLEVEIVEDSVFAKISDTQTPQGILCVMHRLHHDLAGKLAAANGVWMILEDIQDPGNLGTIMRTAEGAGIEGIIMTDSTVDIYNPKTIRSTMGSLYRVPFFVIPSIEDVILQLRELGFAIYAAHLDGSRFYDEFSYVDKCAFLIGNEGNGLSDKAAGLATEYLRIPMEGKVESLNAAI